jgi:hypothetical protein
MEQFLWCLVFLLVLNQVGWMIYSQKLVNKAMSHTFYDYQRAQSVNSALVMGPKPYGPPDNDGFKINLQDEGQETQADLLNKQLGF